MKDFLGDMLIRIKNGQKVQLSSINLHPYTPKYCIELLKLLRDEGYIYGFRESYEEKTQKRTLQVFLKYSNVGTPVIKNIFRVSKPGRRVFLSTKALWKPKSTSGIFIISTPKGFYTDRDARFFNLGGEIVCGIY